MVSTGPREGVTGDDLVSMMMGIDSAELTPRAHIQSNVEYDSKRLAYQRDVSQTGEPAAIEFKEVWTSDANDPRGLHGVCFSVMPGHMLGVAGIAGNGPVRQRLPLAPKLGLAPPVSPGGEMRDQTAHEHRLRQLAMAGDTPGGKQLDGLARQGAERLG